MKTIGLFLLVIALLFSAGCTQSPPAAIPTPDVTPAAPAQPPAPATTALPAAPPTKAPVETVTVVHYIEEEKAWQDSVLRIAFRTPDSWTVTTRQVLLPDGSDGLEFRTTLVPADTFYITTFPISRNQDQDYRNSFRKWTPAPTESTVTVNNIVFDRFESTYGGKTKVGYVARKSSANDLGYSSVIYFVSDDAKPFEKEDYETVVSSFNYLNKQTVATANGNEIPRVR
ncbi:MAG: hypothetical protein GYA23_11520 [Methanomicrobiales archaeon]|nr:hypothetical protein [Methanomicrobiales archaeon]